MSKALEKTYITRYGVRTADQAAHDMLDTAWSRLIFLEEILSNGDNGSAITDHASLGLAAILRDIHIDVHEARHYYLGDYDEPGRVDKAGGAE